MDCVRLDDLDSRPRPDSQAACDLLDLFTSVGAVSFDLTITNYYGEKERFRRHLFPETLKSLLPSLLDDAIDRRLNIIIRPFAAEAHSIIFIQLDDLDAARLSRVQPVTFTSLETSPGNYQAWIATTELGIDKDFARRLRKGVGADPSASGATRVAGSLNFKEKYAPDFPRVEIVHRRLGHIVSAEQLTESGLMENMEITQRPPTIRTIRISRARAGIRQWPSYERCLKNAPRKHTGDSPDVSRADFTWCLTAIDWGWTVEETAARLLEISAKAQENGARYAELTAQNAAIAVKRRTHNEHSVG